MDELNFEINLHRQLIKGNKYQVASFENVILLMQKQLEVQLEKISTLENTIKDNGEVK